MKITANESYIVTYTGKRFYPLAPRVEDVCIEDIAHALANLCRFTGHVSEFDSIAQHCEIVSRLVPVKDALWGLLHDSPEAYLTDMSRPLKHNSGGLGELYRGYEKLLMQVIAAKFGLKGEEPKSVKKADLIVGLTEARDLMPSSEEFWVGMKNKPDCMEEKYVPWLPKEAEFKFLVRFKELTQGRAK